RGGDAVGAGDAEGRGGGFVAGGIDGGDAVEARRAGGGGGVVVLRNRERGTVYFCENSVDGARAVDVVAGEVEVGVVRPVEGDAIDGVGAVDVVTREIAFAVVGPVELDAGAVRRGGDSARRGRAGLGLDVGDQVDVVVVVVINAGVIHGHQPGVGDDVSVAVA